MAVFEGSFLIGRGKNENNVYRYKRYARIWYTCGRGQPLSFTLSFGEIPWFDEKGEIRRCDWSENAFLCMCLV